MFSLESQIVRQVDHLWTDRRYSFTEDITDLEGKTFRCGEEVTYIESEIRHKDGTMRLKFTDGRTLFLSMRQSVRNLLLEVQPEPGPPPPPPAPPVEVGPVEVTPEPEVQLGTLVALARAHRFEEAQQEYLRLMDIHYAQGLAYDIREEVKAIPREEVKAREWIRAKASDAIRTWASWSTSGGEGAARMYEVKKFEGSL